MLRIRQIRADLGNRHLAVAAAYLGIARGRRRSGRGNGYERGDDAGISAVGATRVALELKEAPGEYEHGTNSD